MGLSQHGFLVLIYCLSIFLLVGLTTYALVLGWFFRRRNNTTEAFITARGQVSMWRIAWSFYAGAVGAWVITGPAYYATTAGLVGIVMYAVSSGLPVLMIAYAGGFIQKTLPHVLSLTDFVGWRYGWVAKTYVVLLCCFNMSIALLAEYTTMGSLFKDFVASVPAPIIVVTGLLTNIYTIYGGLLVSIYTDQIQGITSIVFFLMMAFYMAAKFRPDPPLETPIPCSPKTNPMGYCIAGTNEAGWSSVFAMPASLFTATVFSEAMWQRAWASSTKRNLRLGALIGCAGIILVVFFAGFSGLLGAWAGLITTDTNFNLYILTPLTGAMNEASQVANWMGVMVVLLAVTMNMSAVDSLQNGLAAAISSHLLKGVRHSLAWTRVVVLLVNVPLMVLGCKSYNVLTLFLLANMLCSTSAIPVLLGLIPHLHPYTGGFSMLASCFISFVCTSVFGTTYYMNTIWYDEVAMTIYSYTNQSAKRNVATGMHYTWLGNNYAWRYFLVSIFTSLGSMLLFTSINLFWQRFQCCGGKPAVKGFVAPATHPSKFENDPYSPDGDSDKQESHVSNQFKVATEDATTTPAAPPLM